MSLSFWVYGPAKRQAVKTNTQECHELTNAMKSTTLVNRTSLESRGCQGRHVFRCIFWRPCRIQNWREALDSEDRENSEQRSDSEPSSVKRQPLTWLYWILDKSYDSVCRFCLWEWCGYFLSNQSSYLWVYMTKTPWQSIKRWPTGTGRRSKRKWNLKVQHLKEGNGTWGVSHFIACCLKMGHNPPWRGS